MKTTKKLSLVLLALFLVSAGAYAQGNGMAGINAATKMVTSYFDPGTKLIYAIGAVVGLIGGIKVSQQVSSGDPDTSKTAAFLVLELVSSSLWPQPSFVASSSNGIVGHQ